MTFCIILEVHTTTLDKIVNATCATVFKMESTPIIVQDAAAPIDSPTTACAIDGMKIPLAIETTNKIISNLRIINLELPAHTPRLEILHPKTYLLLQK